MTPEEMEEKDILEMSDDDGNSLLLQVAKYFFYNGEEYALMHEYTEDPAAETASYIMKINAFTDENGEEMEEFVTPDESLLDTLMNIAQTQLATDAD